MAQSEQWELDLERAITSKAELSRIIKLTPEENEAIEALRSIYPFKISRHYLNLINQADPADPLRRIVIPTMRELDHHVGEEDDDVHSDEAKYQPVPGIIHRYHGKLLLIPTLGCSSHCRFCFRKGRKISFLTQEETEQALDYIRDDMSIRDVIVTGGDPFILDDDALEYLLSSIRAIPHVEIIRITTRVPIYVPTRITERLVRMLSRHKPLYVIFSFIHPREITPEVERGVETLADAGLVLLQQGPILRGINDDSAVLKKLYERLAALRVLPYYAAWGLHAPGIEHFAVDGETASRLIGSLENRTSGFCVPHLITIARGDKVRMMGWSPEKEFTHLVQKQRARPGRSAPSYVPPGSRHR